MLNEKKMNYYIKSNQEYLSIETMRTNVYAGWHMVGPLDEVRN